MIKTIAVNKNYELVKDVAIVDLLKGEYKWYWIDFHLPTDEEIEYLRDPFHFHPLAIEDCINHLQRPKLDYYEDHTFFITQSLNHQTLTRDEIDFFLGENYIVSFHLNPSNEIEEVWKRFTESTNIEKWEPTHVLYLVLDKIVDSYFPQVFKIEERLTEIDENSRGRSMEALLEDLFDTRHHLLSLRHTISPMRDLIYRVLNSQRLTSIQGKREYYSDIHDHLLKLTEMIEANRELTTDIRDSYISLNSHQTNHVMKVLTVITTIFMPLSFIAGMYGMNFRYMPGLSSKYGFFFTLILMVLVAMGMSLWFKKKGWFK
ncbi:magnesium/cobalt transporter CorA [Neobacillus sp. SuZ13]|uniref:magnesium/cobalt transporter CorA n=1 Tax=Neobacillus sp. SuZ13 TaxID=3047875 RepID=UPI0024BF3051|nr:magnesium/cobalt transporter CorA [Neobacillus sp. SuZ13]WHY69191.1 magnesium/cobalt transporter CorA [Neobacillus sp. SuZ13]